MIEHEPALVGFNRSRTRSDFCSFPVLDRAHNKAVLTPISEVFRLADEYIAVRGVSPVARANKQKILAVHLAREKNAIAGNGIAGILKLSPALEILGIGYTDSCAVRGEIDPREIVFSVELAQARIVAVEDIFILKLPVYRVFAEADNELMGARADIRPENSGKARAVRHNRGIENAVRHMQIVAGDNGIAAVTPHGIFKSCRLILPRDVWYVCSDYFCHI